MFVHYTYLFLLFLSYAFFYFLSYNIFIGLVYLEVASLATSVLLVLHSLYHDDRYSEFFAISLMTIAGAESAVAISLLVSINRLGVILSSEEFSTLKGLSKKICFNFFSLLLFGSDLLANRYFF